MQERNLVGMLLIRLLMFTVSSTRTQNIACLIYSNFTTANFDDFHTPCCSFSGGLVVIVDLELHPFDQIKLKYDDGGRKKNSYILKPVFFETYKTSNT